MRTKIFCPFYYQRTKLPKGYCPIGTMKLYWGRNREQSWNTFTKVNHSVQKSITVGLWQIHKSWTLLFSKWGKLHPHQKSKRYFSFQFFLFTKTSLMEMLIRTLSGLSLELSPLQSKVNGNFLQTKKRPGQPHLQHFSSKKLLPCGCSLVHQAVHHLNPD